jgi:hypothetical protein
VDPSKPLHKELTKWSGLRIGHFGQDEVDGKMPDSTDNISMDQLDILNPEEDFSE